MATDWKILKKFIKNQPMAGFQNNIYRSSCLVTLLQNGHFVFIRQKTWPPVGVAQISLYVYSKILKNLLVLLGGISQER